MLENAAVGDRVRLLYDPRTVRHMVWQCPDLGPAAILRGTVVAVGVGFDGRALRIELDALRPGWRLIVPASDVAADPTPPSPRYDAAPAPRAAGFRAAGAALWREFFGPRGFARATRRGGGTEP